MTIYSVSLGESFIRRHFAVFEDVCKWGLSVCMSVYSRACASLLEPRFHFDTQRTWRLYDGSPYVNPLIPKSSLTAQLAHAPNTFMTCMHFLTGPMTLCIDRWGGNFATACVRKICKQWVRPLKINKALHLSGHRNIAQTPVQVNH